VANFARLILPGVWLILPGVWLILPGQFHRVKFRRRAVGFSEHPLSQVARFRVAMQRDAGISISTRKQPISSAQDVWLCVLTACSSINICKLAQTCKMFKSIVEEAAVEKLSPTGFFSPAICDYLESFGGKTAHKKGNVMSMSDETKIKNHGIALKSLRLLSVSLFSSIIKVEMQIHGMRLLTEFLQKGILEPSQSEFASPIKRLFYYEKTMAKVVDIVMLQGILCNIFQLSAEEVTKFCPSQVQCSANVCVFCMRVGIITSDFLLCAPELCDEGCTGKKNRWNQHHADAEQHDDMDSKSQSIRCPAKGNKCCYVAIRRCHTSYCANDAGHRP